MAALEALANQDREENWASGLRNLVPTWQEKFAKWEKIEKKLEGWSKPYAKGQLRKFRRGAPWFLKEIARDAEKNLGSKPATTKKKKDDPEPEVDAAALLADAKATSSAAVEKLDFAAALAGVDALRATVTAEPEAGEVARLVDRYRRLRDMQAFLVKEVEAKPSPKPVAELGGPIVGGNGRRVAGFGG